MTSTTLGITSPPRSTLTQSPIFRPRPLDEVGVVERGAADGGAADEDWRQFGYGGELAGAAHLHGDGEDLGDAGFGGELVGDGPARGAAGVAEALLGGVGVDFEDYAVDFVAECGALGFGFVDESGHLVDGVRHGSRWGLTRKPRVVSASSVAACPCGQ